MSPPRLEACVKSVMEKQGYPESRAYAICTAAMKDDKLIIGDRSPFKASIDATSGFLTAPVTLARTGIQYYMGFELGLADRAMEKIGVFRSPEEVFHPDSIASFTNLVATDDHPTELVTVDNVKKLQIGTVSSVNGNGTSLNGVVTITDVNRIKKLKDGKVEVSVGYTNDLIVQKGTYEGVSYEFAQTNIRANHLAVVDTGRCGPDCRIILDNKKETKPVKITIDGIEYDVESLQLAQAIQKRLASHDAEKEKLESEKEEAIKEKDKAEAAKDAMAKTVLDADAINTLVSERAVLLTTARGILGDKMPECLDCPKEIKTAVIDKVLAMGDLSAKSADYVDAAYDMAVSKAEKSKKALDSLQGDFKTKDGKAVTRGSARVKYMADHLKIEGA